MPASPEWLLAGALVAIYVLDSIHFLRIGEAVVSTRPASLRGLSFGSVFELGGRRPYLPNPLTPWRSELRVDWSTSVQGSTSEQIALEMRQHLRTLRPIGWFASACAGLIAVIAPLALVIGHEGAFAVSVLLCVLCALPACVLVIRRRQPLGLSGWQAVSVSVVALVCLPCSGNVARAAAIQRRWTVQATDLPRLGFEVDQRAGIESRVREMLMRAQRLWAEDSAEYRSVTSQLEQLEASPHEPH
jgi:hypothetical protein